MDELAGRYQGRTFGNYRLLKLIGEGGFSEVYLGEHLHLGTEAAVKVLRTRLTDEEFERFRQEAQTIIGLGHPNMVRVLDFGLQDRIPFLVMSYAPHGSLRDLYPDGTRLPLQTVVALVRQVANVLQYAHYHRVIHRDIKPDNLLIGSDGEVLLSDFGIAVVGWSADVTYVAVGDANGNIHLLSDNDCSCFLYQTGFHGHNGQINAITWSPDNQAFATASDDGTIQVWSGMNGAHEQTYSNLNKAKMSTVAWSPDGKVLLSGDETGSVLLWRAI